MSKFRGIAGWAEHDSIYAGRVVEGAKRDEPRTDGDAQVLHIEIDADGERYDVHLIKRGGTKYRGEWKTATTDGSCSATLFRAGKESLLFGSWHEEEDDYAWWVEVESDTEPDGPGGGGSTPVR